MDADDVTLSVEKGASRIAADERAVGDEHRVGFLEQATEANDRFASFFVAAGMAGRDAPLADAHFVRLGHRSGRPRTFVDDADEGRVEVAIEPQRFAPNDSSVGQDDVAGDERPLGAVEANSGASEGAASAAGSSPHRKRGPAMASIANSTAPITTRLAPTPSPRIVTPCWLPRRIMAASP